MKHALHLADRDFISVDGSKLHGGPAGEGPGATAFSPHHSPRRLEVTLHQGNWLGSLHG